MSSNLFFSIIPITVVLLIYNVWFFLLFDNYTTSSWVVYTFTMIAFLLAIVIGVWNSIKKDSIFFKANAYITSIAYIAIQIVSGRMLMFVEKYKTICLIEMIICIGVLFVLIGLEINKIIAKKEDEDMQVSRAFKKDMYMRILSLKIKAVNKEQVKEIEKLEDAVKYSDPVSGLECKKIELEFEEIIRNIENIIKMNENGISDLVGQALKKLDERNNICKLKK